MTGEDERLVLGLSSIRPWTDGPARAWRLEYICNYKSGQEEQEIVDVERGKRW